jgi:hypothetical protein
MIELKMRKSHSFVRRILETMGIYKYFTRFSFTQGEERFRTSLPWHIDSRRIVEPAWLEAERRKSEAIEESRKHSAVC